MVAAWRSEKYPTWYIKGQRMDGSGGDGEGGREGGRKREREREGRRERGSNGEKDIRMDFWANRLGFKCQPHHFLAL